MSSHSPLEIVRRRVAPRDDWDTALDLVLREPARVSMRFQPIADLTRGIVTGFEALARFDGPIAASPDVWFREAARRGCALDLEILAARRALEAVSALPPNCFLTINVSPELLVSPLWRSLVSNGRRLDNVIVEVTEHAAIADYDAVRTCIAAVRALGGGFAVDDAGSGFASLNHVLALKPNFVKLDRVFVDGCDQDAAKLALIEMMGSFAGRLDGWIIAEGVETRAELQALVRLEVPLAQGYLLGKPQPSWTGIDPAATAALLSWQDARRAGQAITLIAEEPRIVSIDDPSAIAPSSDRTVVVVDEWHRPVRLFAPDRRSSVEVMRVKASSPARDVLRRALARDADMRFMPVVVIDEVGRVESIVRIERLVEMVAFSTMPASPPA
ncbi:MAG: EAL domain-containing protein [Acidobacteria bacterium]|nr:EAL domain-containing protein [Acidobacteriota bacterium]